VKLSIHLLSNRFLSGETILFTVRLTNDGAAAVEVPDPDDGGSARIRYQVVGPAYPEPAAFPRGKRATASASMSVKPVLLAPGAAIDYEIELERLIRFPEPGEYRVSTTMDAGGKILQADAVKITIEHPEVRSARIMADDGFQEAALQRVLVMLGTPGRLYQMMFRENRPAIGEIKPSGLVTADTTPLPMDANAVYAPWTRFNRVDLDESRAGWISTKAIGIETSEEPGSAVTFELSKDAVPVYPPFLLRDGRVLGWLRTNRTLQLVEFPVSGSPAKLEWEASCDGTTVSSAVAALSREGDIPCAMTVGQPSGGEVDTLPVSLYRAGSGDPIVVEIPDAIPLPDSEPTAWVDKEGGVHAALLVQDKPKSKDAKTISTSYVEINWTPPPEVEKPVVNRYQVVSTPVENAPVASRVCHSIARAGAFRVDWVIQLADGKSLSRTAPTEPQSFPGKPVRPLQLMPMSTATYLLTHDKAQVLKFWKVI